MRLIFSLSLALIAASATPAEVYRTIGPDGTIIYSDRPLGPDAEPVTVTLERTASAAAQAPAVPPPEPSPPLDAAESAQASQELAEQRQRNCEIARARADSYSAANRLFRQLPNGEREYLNDAEIDEARAQAAADVEAWCS